MRLCNIYKNILGILSNFGLTFPEGYDIIDKSPDEVGEWNEITHKIDLKKNFLRIPKKFLTNHKLCDIINKSRERFPTRLKIKIKFKKILKKI